VASATATLEHYNKLSKDNASIVNDIRDLKKLAENGDQAASEAIAVSVDYLARATLTLINFLNPDVFIFTGGMASLGDMLLDPVRKYVRSSTFQMLGEKTQIAVGSLGMYSGCFGAAFLALSGAKVLPK